MSLQNITKENNYKLYCSDISAKKLDIESVLVENIEIVNANVSGVISTSNIISNDSTFNTIGTINLDSLNGNFVNLLSENLTVNNNTLLNNVNISGTLTAASFNPSSITTNNLTVNNLANIDTLDVNNLNLSNNLLVPGDITCTNLSVTTTANIDTLNILDTLNLDNNLLVPGDISCNSLTSTTSINGNSVSTSTGNINTISGGGLTYGTGNVTSLSGNDLNYNTGSIQSINGNDISYNTGIISTLNGSEFSYDIGYAVALSCKELRIFTQLVECPNATIDTINNITSNITTATIDTANITNLNVPGGLAVGGVVSAASFIAPSASINTLTLGALGPTPSSALSFYYYDTTNVAITGGATGTTTFFRGIRIGNAVTLQIGLPGALTAVSNSQPINIAVPLPFRNPTSCRGTCLMLKGASTIQATWATGVTSIQIYAGLLLSNFWNIGELCSFSEGGTWSFDWVV